MGLIKKAFSYILRAPLALLILVSWGASFYVAYTNMMGIGWDTPIIFSVIMIMHFIGKALA